MQSKAFTQIVRLYMYVHGIVAKANRKKPWIFYERNKNSTRISILLEK